MDNTTSTWRSRLFAGLGKSRDKITQQLKQVFSRGKLDEESYELLESTLISADVGLAATEWLIKELRLQVKKQSITDEGAARVLLGQLLGQLLRPLEAPIKIPPSSQSFVIMVAGVNGSGKTTSIGKLAHYYQLQGKSVLLAAGDTFRAAAREQLIHWGAENDVPVISQERGDPAAVIFDAVTAANARKIDIVIADTAGRLPTQQNLMGEISRVQRVIKKVDPTAPHETLLILDATIGQNAVQQVAAFDQALGITGLILTKLDGTARGGVIAAIAKSNPKPVRFIGVGEGIDDLRPFVVDEFVAALLGLNA